MMALLSLRGPALKLAWVDTLGNDYNWEFLKEQIQERFGERPQEIMDRLSSRVQDASESVGAHTNDYLNLLIRAANTGNAIPERLKLTGYVEGLLPKLQDSLILKEPETLTDAVRSAKYLEFQAQRFKSKGRKSVLLDSDQRSGRQAQDNRDQQNQLT
jgi:hypothetical protein